MSTHRRHTFDIDARRRAARDLWTQRKAPIVAIATAVIAIVGLTFALERPQPVATPIPMPAVTTYALLPASSTLTRTLHDRLGDWRAGYEAAVQNGCELKPMFTIPIAAQP